MWSTALQMCWLPWHEGSATSMRYLPHAAKPSTSLDETSLCCGANVTSRQKSSCLPKPAAVQVKPQLLPEQPEHSAEPLSKPCLQCTIAAETRAANYVRGNVCRKHDTPRQSFARSICLHTSHARHCCILQQPDSLSPEYRTVPSNHAFPNMQ
jgi:hypothetical protein